MATSQPKKHQLQMVGEYGVCAELCKQGYDVSLTLGNTKAVDVLVLLPNNTYFKIEVKTTRSTKFVTNFFQKFASPTQNPHPDYWVLVYIDKNNVSHYYVLSHQEMANEQMRRNGMSQWTHIAKGVDNVLVRDLSNYESVWNKIPK